MNKIDGAMFKIEEKISDDIKPGVYIVAFKDNKVVPDLIPVEEEIPDLNNKQILFVNTKLIKEMPGHTKYSIEIEQAVKLNRGIEQAIEKGEVFMLIESIYTKIYKSETNEESSFITEKPKV